MGRVFEFGRSLCAVLPGEVICLLAGEEEDQESALELAKDYGYELEWIGALSDGQEIAIFNRRK